MIVTDFNLDPLARYESTVQLTRPALEALRANPVVVEMHRENQLIHDLKNAKTPLFEVESEMIDVLKAHTAFDQGEFAIAGSGVIAFDHPLLKDKMPRFSNWLTYYGYDVGVMRRMAKLFSGGRDVVNPMPQSYKDGAKLHRAMADVEAHLTEAERYRDWFREKMD